MSSSRLRRVALISAGDLMACFVGLLLLVQQTERHKIRREVEDVKEQTAIELAKQQELKAEQQRLEEEVQSLRKKKWQLIATQWRVGGAASNLPTVKIYAFKDGVFDSPQSQVALSDAALRSWLRSRPPDEERIVIYVENGGNDQFLRVREALEETGRFDTYSMLTLPSDMDPR